MIVMKFGGSSIANADRIRNVAKIVKSQAKRNPIVVVSGLGGVTDNLIDAANIAAEGNEANSKADAIVQRHYDAISELNLSPQIIINEVQDMTGLLRKISRIRKLKPEALDRMMSLGERMSVRIIAAYLSSIGMPAVGYDAYDIGMLTDSNFGNADVLSEAYSRIRNSLKRISETPIITGFIAKDRKGNITTLGRGGSDYTACIIGSAIDAEEIQIWTNVDGIMTADPRIVSAAKNISKISYEEEAELEFLGANTLHPKGILPAIGKNINVRILNTLNPKHRGTLITRNIEVDKRAASITHKENLSILKIHYPKLLSGKTPISKTLEIFERNNLKVDQVSSSRTGILLTINNKHNGNLKKALNESKRMGRIEVSNGMAKVSIVGKSIASIPGISSKILSSVKGIPVEIASFGSSPNSQSFVVKEEDAGKAINLLHDTFFGR